MLNPIMIKKNIEKITGNVTNMQFLKSGNLFVTPKDRTQEENLLKCTILNIKDRNVEMKISGDIIKNKLYGRIHAPNPKEADMNDVLSEIQDQGVTKIEKFFKGPTKSHIPVYLLTFSGNQLPQFV